MSAARSGIRNTSRRHHSNTIATYQMTTQATSPNGTQIGAHNASATRAVVAQTSLSLIGTTASSVVAAGAPARIHSPSAASSATSRNTASNLNTIGSGGSPSSTNAGALAPTRPSAPPATPSLPSAPSAASPTPHTSSVPAASPQPLVVQTLHSTANIRTPPPPPTLLKHRLRRIVSRWNDWWLLEITAGVLSIVCLVTIIAILAHFDGKPLAKWHSRITPNAMISVLATVSRSSVLLPVAECISQLTWLRFQKPHTLQLIQEFDEASRGALGSFQILFSTEAIAAWFGAIITLASLAFEPFAQQVLLLNSRELLVNTTSTSVPVSTVFNTGKTNPVSFPVNYYPLGDLAHALDPSIRAAGFDGIYSNAITPPYDCRAPTCRYGNFASLAVCSSCTDVLQKLKNHCNGTCVSWTYTTPANISIQARYQSGASTRTIFATLFNSSAKRA